jgi:hypothetical protein
MRKRQSFLLTIISPENGDSSLCGRLQVISSGKTISFCCMEEMFELIHTEMEKEELVSLSGASLPRSCTKDSLPAS